MCTDEKNFLVQGLACSFLFSVEELQEMRLVPQLNGVIQARVCQLMMRPNQQI